VGNRILEAPRPIWHIGPWLLALLVLAACGGSTTLEAGAPPEASDVTTSLTSLVLNPNAGVTTTTRATRTSGARVLPLAGPLEPGVRYEPAAFDPPVSVVLPQPGWEHQQFPPFPVTDLMEFGKNLRADGEADVYVGFLRVSDVWSEHLVPDPVVPKEASSVVAAPTDLYGWFTSIPHTRVTEPQRTTVGGYPATTFNLEVLPLPRPEAAGTCNGRPCLLLFSLQSPGGYTAAFEGTTAQYWIIDAGANRYVAVVELGGAAGSGAANAALRQEALDVVGSFKAT